MDVFNLVAIGTIQSRIAKLAAYLATLTGSAYLVAKLFQAGPAMTPSSVLSGFTEATYSGYSPIAISAFNGPFLDAQGVAYAATDVLPFACDGGGVSNSIGTAGICDSTGAAATATATQSGGAVDAITVTSSGAGYQLPPRVTITDATIGTGATAHAVLTAGVVSSIVIDTGGSGYTGPLVAIERPVQLVQGFNLINPQSMSLVTDGLLLTLEIDQEN